MIQLIWHIVHVDMEQVKATHIQENILQQNVQNVGICMEFQEHRNKII